MVEQYNPSQLYDIKVNSPKTSGHHDNIIEGHIKTPDGIFVATYYELRGEPSGWGTEIYTGSNYIVGSTKKSYSRNYKSWRGLPDKWKLVAKRLKDIHRKRF